MVLAWVPALFVLSGRMYIRPETLSLLYLSIYLAVISRWDRYPALAWLLPIVQVAWVNSHGLFVLGPVILGFALIDAILRRGAFAPERKRWWQSTVAACAASGLACLANPYGVHGAIYPLELAGTMANPIFSRNIAELKPIPQFIKEAGFANLPLQLHLVTMMLGALSFLIPMTWLAWVRLRAASTEGETRDADQTEEKQKSPKSTRKRRKKRRDLAVGAFEDEGSWKISPFRLLLFVAFSTLSFQATRNSHQFAAVVGTVTAWNFAQWAATRQRQAARGVGAGGESPGLKPRLVVLLVLGLAFAWVGSGQFYAMTGEGRTIAWGEEPLWFPHEAAKFAGEPEMPRRFLSYHNAHASVFEYYHSPESFAADPEGGSSRTVYTDPRLEIAGADLFERYLELGSQISKDQPGWARALDDMGNPSIMVDHHDNSMIGASLMANPHWRCVWFDPIVAVFVHESYANLVKQLSVDFGARHFLPDPATEPQGIPALQASAKGLRNYLNFHSMSRADLARPLIWLGLDYARRIVERIPDSAEGWKTIGQIETFRDPMEQPSPRFRMPFDPVFDLEPARATYALRRANELAPRDFMTILCLAKIFEVRVMNEALLPLLDELVQLQPINQLQRVQQATSEADRVRLRQSLVPLPTKTWKNLAELGQIVSEQLARGRARTAAEILEQAYPVEKAPWEVVDQVATLRMHLGEPEKARSLWKQATLVPKPAVRDARVAATYLAENQLDAARRAYEQALASEPGLFEARFGLAVLEQDAGRASAAYEHALAALESAPSEVSRAAARAIASGVSRYAKKETSRSVSWNEGRETR
jgi:tetratricopeptide (TPR) repeat protein